MLDMLKDQFLRYHWSVKKATSEHASDKVKLTGKIGNLQDDLLIASSMVLYGGRLITRDPSRLQMVRR